MPRPRLVFLLCSLLCAVPAAWGQANERATDALKRLDQSERGSQAERSAEEAPAEQDPEAPAAPVVPSDGPIVPERPDSGSEPEDADEPPERPTEEARGVVVVPISDAISTPNRYILRRGVKEAIASGAEVLVLEIDSPGGRVDIMLEMMETIDRFGGTTIAYVNDEALSAGALIASVADEIWYAPRAVIGSAGLVSGGGEDIPETMRQKVESYVRAKLRALSSPHPYREQVVRAMMDSSYELEIEGTMISPEGEMLNLTAEEALRTYGDPARPLFGDGQAESLDALLDQRLGSGQWTTSSFEVTWSEELAKYLNSIAPLLVAFGIVGVFIEFKTPGFGIFGILGISLLAVVFISNYVAGLAGWEPFIFLLLGLALVAVDIFLLPGTFVLGIIGGILAFGSLLWSMTDIWPAIDGTGIDVNWISFYQASARLSLGVILGCILMAVLWRLLPRTHLLDRLVLGGAAGVQGIPTPAEAEQAPPGGAARWPSVGSIGEVTRALRPAGEVEIGGRRFEARVTVGMLPRGAGVRVVRRAQFGLEVEPSEEA